MTEISHAPCSKNKVYLHKIWPGLQEAQKLKWIKTAPQLHCFPLKKWAVLTGRLKMWGFPPWEKDLQHALQCLGKVPWILGEGTRRQKRGAKRIPFQTRASLIFWQPCLIPFYSPFKRFCSVLLLCASPAGSCVCAFWAHFSLFMQANLKYKWGSIFGECTDNCKWE